MLKTTQKYQTRLGTSVITLNMPSTVDMTEQQFFQFCQLNRDLRIERTVKGDVILMGPAGGGTSARNMKLSTALGNWAEKEGTGIAFDSSGGFNLPSGATRSPDAAWVRRDRLAALTSEEKERFLPLCPDFVVELRSPTDSLSMLQGKMGEYVQDGARLGWLIDAENLQVYVYRPGGPVKQLDHPSQISGDPVLPGFVLDLNAIWEIDF